MQGQDCAWSVRIPVDDVPEAGRHLDLTADAATRLALARQLGLRDLPRLEASFDVTRRGREGLRVAGRVSATVGQDCVVSLEPLENEVVEEIDLVFSSDADRRSEPEAELLPDSRDPPEPLRDGAVDLGAIACEFLALGIEPYPRKPGAALDIPPTDADVATHPFAALASLKKTTKGEGKP